MDGVRPTILNPETVSRCDGPHDVGRCHAADTCRKTTNRGVLFELVALGDSVAYQCTLLYYTTIKYTVLHCTILYYMVPNSTVLHYTIIHSVVL